MIYHFVVEDKKESIAWAIACLRFLIQVNPVLRELENPAWCFRGALEKRAVFYNVVSQTLPELIIHLAVQRRHRDGSFLSPVVTVGEALVTDIVVEDSNRLCKPRIRIGSCVGGSVDPVTPCVVSVSIESEPWQPVDSACWQHIVAEIIFDCVLKLWSPTERRGVSGQF